MIRKTYGAKGLMEWQCQIAVGKTLLHVPFTGGTQTEYGVTPAKYTTQSPVVQAIIEHSEYFRGGRITLLESKEIAAKDATAQAATKKVATKKSTATTEQKEVINPDTDADTSDVKNFSTYADGKAYVIANCNDEDASNLRSIQDVLDAATRHGIRMKIGDKKNYTEEK